MAVNEGILDSVSHANTKTIAEAAAHSMALAMQNAVANQDAMNQVRLAAAGNIAKRMTEVDPTEALAVLRAGGTNLQDLAAAVAFARQASSE